MVYISSVMANRTFFSDEAVEAASDSVCGFGVVVGLFPRDCQRAALHGPPETHTSRTRAWYALPHEWLCTGCF